MTTTVVNVNRDAYDVYIGRFSMRGDGYFGNPFKRPFNEPPGSTLDDYRAYFITKVVADPEFRERVLALKDKTLGCFCKPNPCHGDIIAEWLDTAGNV